MPKAPSRPPVKPAVNVKNLRARQAKRGSDAPETITLVTTQYKGRLRGQGRHGDGDTSIVVPTTKEFGNSVGDRRWFFDAIEADYVEEIGADETEIPSGSTFRYIGPMEIPGHYWNWPLEDDRCEATAFLRDNQGHYILGSNNHQLKRPCARQKILGGNVCISHGGGIERVRKAAELRLVGAADSLIGALINIALDAKQDGRARVQAINSALDRAGIKGVTQVEIDIPLYKDVAKDLFKRWGEDEDDGDSESAG